LKTLSAHPTLDSQIIRLNECGFSDGQNAIDINYGHDQWMGKEELRRIARLEMLDEMEEWRLLAGHYCIAWGWKQPEEPGLFDVWKNIKYTRA
jgi:[phosphatase 2A protein]-leucine-carboxy methyltransferase